MTIVDENVHSESLHVVEIQSPVQPTESEGNILFLLVPIILMSILFFHRPTHRIISNVVKWVAKVVIGAVGLIFLVLVVVGLFIRSSEFSNPLANISISDAGWFLIFVTIFGLIWQAWNWFWDQSTKHGRQ